MAASTPAVTTEDVRCAVCYEYFDRKTHLPKRLPCPHSICLSCLGELAKIPPTKCPLCKRYFRIPADGVGAMATDLPTLKLLDMMTCKQCNNIGELSNCRRCKIRICEKCESSHRSPTHCKLLKKLVEVDEQLKKDKEELRRAPSRYRDLMKAMEEEIEMKFETIRQALCKEEQALKKYVRVFQNSIKCKNSHEEMIYQDHCRAFIISARLLLEGEHSEKELSDIIQEAGDIDLMLENRKPVQRSITLMDFETKAVEFIKEMKDWGVIFNEPETCANDHQDHQQACKRGSAAEPDESNNDTSSPKRSRANVSTEGTES